MIIYKLNPDFDSSYMYDDFYQKVGGKFWQNLETPINNLKKALTNREYLLSMFIFGVETKDENVDVSINYNLGEITISMQCFARSIEYKNVIKSVTVDGEDFSKVVSVRIEHEWKPYTASRSIFFDTIETAD